MKFSAVVSALVVASAAAFAPSTTEVCFFVIVFWRIVVSHTFERTPQKHKDKPKTKVAPI